MKKFQFTLLHKDKEARLGLIYTAHGTVETPVFMPVGTRGSVKTMNPNELKVLGTQILLGNTYHLFLKPGDKNIAKLGGLHQFMNFRGPILTDSGGYQVFSLSEGKEGSLVKITEEGVRFQSVYDGSKHLFTPEKVIDIQTNLGSDIMMPLDVCPSAEADKAEIEKAVALTSAWFARAKKHHLKKKNQNSLFAIIQGGTHQDLRQKSFEELNSFEPDGFSIGGVANAGESKAKQKAALNATLPLIPPEKPRYLMGVGEPEDILTAVELGVDMFDCVSPTRLARNGTVYTRNGKINLNNAKFKLDKAPIETDCDCYACQNFSKAYIRHLLNVGEILGIRLTTIHNLRFIMKLMKDIRKSIKNDKFQSFKKSFLMKYLHKF